MSPDEYKKQFLAWEATTHDTIDFKKIYVDMAGDILAGLMLSEIVYWFLPSKRGENKLRVQKEGEYWLAVSRAEWWDRIRLTPRQADTAIAKLLGCGLLVKKVFKFDGTPTTHVRINWEMFLHYFNSKSQIGEITENVISISPKLQHPLTETTAETTKEKPLSPATQDDGAAPLPTSVVSTQDPIVTDDTVTPAKVKPAKKTCRLLKRDVANQLIPVLFKYGKGRTLESYSQPEVATIMRNQFTPLLKALQPLDDEHPIDAMELDAAFRWFRKQYKDASYPCGAKTVATMLVNYRAYKRSLQVPKAHLVTPAIDSLLAQPAPTYADSVDINDVRIIGETK